MEYPTACTRALSFSPGVAASHRTLTYVLSLTRLRVELNQSSQLNRDTGHQTEGLGLRIYPMVFVNSSGRCSTSCNASSLRDSSYFVALLQELALRFTMLLKTLLLAALPILPLAAATSNSGTCRDGTITVYGRSCQRSCGYHYLGYPYKIERKSCYDTCANSCVTQSKCQYAQWNKQSKKCSYFDRRPSSKKNNYYDGVNCEKPKTSTKSTTTKSTTKSTTISAVGR